MISKKFLVIALLFLLINLFPITTFAIGPSFTVTPTKVELSLDPGQVETREVVIYNNLGVKAKFEISVEDYVLDKDGKSLDFLGTEQSPFSLKNFISVSDANFVLASGQKKTILVRTQLPGNVPLGSLHGALFVLAKPDSGVVGATQISSRIGVLFFVKVAGVVLEKGELQSFGVAGGNLQLGKLAKPEVFISFKNEGNTYVNPYGLIEVSNIFAKHKKNIQVDPWFVLPKSTRTRELTLGDDWFGIYRLSLFQNRGYQDIIDKDSVIIVRLPWHYLIMIGGLITGFVVIFSLIWKFKKR